MLPALKSVVFVTGMLAATVAVAAPTGAPAEGSGTSPVLCEKGFAYSGDRQACVSVASGEFDDRELLAHGRALAAAGRYSSALDVLDAIKAKNSAEVLTMLGFVKRKSGQFDEGMAHYYQALAMDPHNADAREYLGQGYAETDRLDLARAELDRLKRICGVDCEQYRSLAEAISAAPAK